MSDTTKTLTTRLDVAGLLGVLFIGLKLGGIITWPWAWVLAPFWIPVALIVVLFIIVFTVYAVTGTTKAKK